MDQFDELEQSFFTNQEHFRFVEVISSENNFGVWKLSIQNAAELLACDMWASGVLEVKSFDEDFDDPSVLSEEVKAALADEISAMVIRLIKAVEIGRLKPECVSRDLDENIICHKTFIDIDELKTWIAGRGYTLSGEAYDEWAAIEFDVSNSLVREVVWLRSVKGRPDYTSHLVGYASSSNLVDETNHAELLAAYKAAIQENGSLRNRLNTLEKAKPANCDIILSTKKRNTHLLIINALCNQLGLKVGERGVPTRIAKFTDETGASVDAGTVSGILVNIPDAIESRSRG